MKAQPISHQEPVVVLLRGKTQRCPLPIFAQRVQHERELRMRESAKDEGESPA